MQSFPPLVFFQKKFTCEPHLYVTTVMIFCKQTMSFNDFETVYARRNDRLNLRVITKREAVNRMGNTDRRE